MALPPRPSAPPATGGFPPYRTSDLDRLGRIRRAFTGAGWLVLPGYLPRCTAPGWWERRAAEAGLDAPATADVAALPAAIPATASGPDPERYITAIHPRNPLAVTVERVEAGRDIDVTLWWEGGYASHPGAAVPPRVQAEVGALILGALPTD